MGHLLAIHVRLSRPPQLSRQGIDGDRHMGVGPADLQLSEHRHPPRRPHLAHLAAHPQPYLVVLHNSIYPEFDNVNVEKFPAVNISVWYSLKDHYV